MSRLYLSNPCAFLCYPLHTAMRAQSAPGFPCALSSERDDELAKPGRKRAAGRKTRIPMSSLGSTGRPGIPETHVIEPRSGSVLDTRMRGYDTGE